MYHQLHVPVCELKRVYESVKSGNKELTKEMIDALMGHSTGKQRKCVSKSYNKGVDALDTEQQSSLLNHQKTGVFNRPSLCFRTQGRDDPARMDHFLKHQNDGLFFNLNRTPTQAEKGAKKVNSLMDSRFKQVVQLGEDIKEEVATKEERVNYLN